MKEVFTEDDRHYIYLLQENMNRTASARANAKIWLATLATAIAALNFSREGDLLIWIAVIMVVVFYLMDCLYLTLEQRYLHLMHTFVDVCKEGDEEKNFRYSRRSHFLFECYGFQPYPAVLPYPFPDCSCYQSVPVI